MSLLSSFDDPAARPRNLSAFTTLSLALGLCGICHGASAAEATVTVTGKLATVVADDFAGRRSELLYFLDDRANQRTLQLQFSGRKPAWVSNGRTVTLRGRLDQGRLVLDDAQARYLAADSTGGSAEILAGSTEVVTGDQRTLVVLADFQDVALDCTADAVRTIMFDEPQDKSVDDLYRESSHGAVGFSGKVVGPYRINYTSDGSCDINGWATELEARAAAAGEDLTLYPRKVFVLPRQNTCNASGYGSLGGSSTRAWAMRCELPGLYAHELGHNLGMNHATTPTSSYGDGSDPMGMAVLGLRQHNAPHQEQMGWRAPDRFQAVTSSGRYDIAPTELLPAEAVAPQALVIAKPDTSEYYYLSWRAPIGFDTSLSTGLLDRLHIHRYARNGGRTIYETGLLLGETFSDTANSIRVTHVSRATNYATVDVQFGPGTTPTCERLAPAFSVSPASQSAQAGSLLKYGVVVTNRDGAACAATSFSVAASAPSGWSISVSPQTLSLAPGAQASVTVAVTSASNAAASSYTIGASATDAAVAGHSASATASYGVLASCVRRAPVLSLSPEAQSGGPGQSLRYGVSLSNQDAAGCTTTTFSLSRAVPSGWTGTLSQNSVTLVPGSAAQLLLDVSAPASATSGTYTLLVDAADATGRSSSDTGSYTIVSTAQDTQAPSAPTGLTASPNLQKMRVSLSWAASTDNVGVAGYRVWRDGQFIGQSAGTWFVDGSVVAGASHSYHVTAVDAAGNQSAASTAVSATLKRGKTKG